ncbi:MAG: sugar phosphate isomerase/epimerase [Clostridia bacterium]|nr:sugar phosphate isomerase/epimerase [Clostridia bacterium]
MNYGASTACFYPVESELGLKTLLECGYKYIELFTNTISETEPEYIKTLKKTADEYGAKFVSLHPYTCLMEGMYFFSGYERRFHDGTELYRKYFNAANLLGAEVLVFHGQAAFRDKYAFSDDFYLERFVKLSEEAEKFGVILCQENVCNYRAGNIDFVRYMKSQLKEKANFVFDIKQARLVGYNPIDMINAMGNSIRHVHLSDADENSKCLLPGFGNEKFEAVFDALRKNRFDGNVLAEVYSDAIDSNEQLVTSLKHMKKIVPDMIFS